MVTRFAGYVNYTGGIIWENISIPSMENIEEKLTVLNDTMILSFDMTIRNLLEENAPIDSDTIAARNFYVYTNALCRMAEQKTDVKKKGEHK